MNVGKMARHKSPFKDNKEFIRDIQRFLSKHGATFAQHMDRTSAHFEVAVYNDVVRFYEANGYTISAENLRNGQFVYALSANAKPSRRSYFRVERHYVKNPSRAFEIRHNLRIRSQHDPKVFVSPDYAVIDAESIVSERKSYYYNAKADYFFVSADSLATFAETKHYNPSPELVLNFVGIVNELFPELMNGAAPRRLPKHFGPTLFVSGVGREHVRAIKDSLMARYEINVLLGLFAYPSQLYSRRNQGYIAKIGSK